jgi:uncharacterized membrane protein
LVPDVSAVLIWAALLGGSAAAAAALYGRYRVLPGWLTGPEICKLEYGGCAVLFRSPRASLLGVPNAALGLMLYALLAVGVLLRWPDWWLLTMTVPALVMSVFLGWSLLVNHRQCRICWTGHFSNALLFLLMLGRSLG